MRASVRGHSEVFGSARGEMSEVRRRARSEAAICPRVSVQGYWLVRHGLREERTFGREDRIRQQERRCDRDRRQVRLVWGEFDPVCGYLQHASLIWNLDVQAERLTTSDAWRSECRVSRDTRQSDPRGPAVSMRSTQRLSEIRACCRCRGVYRSPHTRKSAVT